MSEIYDSNCDHFNELLRRVWATRSKRFSNDLDRAKANMALEQIIKMLDGHIYNAMLKLVKAGEA